MALIKCPECKKKVSDQCGNCPHCGYPIISISQYSGIEKDSAGSMVHGKKPLYRRVWFWVCVGVVLIGLALSILLLLTQKTQPLFDANGNPIFIEFTNEVYTNANEYKGYYINIKGKVFQVMSDNGETKGIQIWADPHTCEQNIMIYYRSDVEIKQGDYVICSGYIDSVKKYQNAYGATLFAPVLKSADIKVATYIDVMAPALETITPENLNYRKHGYSISIERIAFAESETRVYVTATNSGTGSLRIGDAVIVQNGKQYNSTPNYEADYTQLPYEIVKGASSSGIIVFPAISSTDFELTIDFHSDNYNETFDKFKFVIGKNTSDVLDYGYESAIQAVIDLCNGELEDVGSILPEMLWVAISKDNDMSTQEVKDTIRYWYSDSFASKCKTYTILGGERLSQNVLKECLDGIKYRYERYGLNTLSISDGYIFTVELTETNGDKTIYLPVLLKIDNNWYWTELDDLNRPYFFTGPFTPAA